MSLFSRPRSRQLTDSPPLFGCGAPTMKPAISTRSPSLTAPPETVRFFNLSLLSLTSGIFWPTRRSAWVCRVAKSLKLSEATRSEGGKRRFNMFNRASVVPACAQPCGGQESRFCSQGPLFSDCGSDRAEITDTMPAIKARAATIRLMLLDSVPESVTRCPLLQPLHFGIVVQGEHSSKLLCTPGNEAKAAPSDRNAIGARQGRCPEFSRQHEPRAGASHRRDAQDGLSTSRLESNPAYCEESRQRLASHCVHLR